MAAILAAGQAAVPVGLSHGDPLELSVIILNWNTAALLRQCLRSIQCSRAGIDLEVLVIDNASEDASRDVVEREFPWVRLMVNKRNMGFGAGNNRGIPETTGRYLLFLNSDTIVGEKALDRLVQFADQNPDAAIIGPKLLNQDGSLQYSCRRFPNLATGLFRNTPLGRMLRKNRFNADYLMQEWDHSTERDVDWVSGAALLARRTAVEQLGGFDEEYYMYCEDVDLCWRVHHLPLPAELSSTAVQAGAASPPGARCWRVVYFPGCAITHFTGKSSDKAPTRMTYEFHRSQYLFYKKHYRQTTPVWVRPLIPAGIGLRAVGQMCRYRYHYLQRRFRGQEPRHARR